MKDLADTYDGITLSAVIEDFNLCVNPPRPHVRNLYVQCRDEEAVFFGTAATIAAQVAAAAPNYGAAAVAIGRQCVGRM